DRTVRLWDLATLTPATAIPAQADWVQAMAFTPDGARLAMGRYDGSLAFWDLAGGKPGVVLRQPPAQAPAQPPHLVREAALNPPQPRGAVRGSRAKLTLSGTGVGRATAVILPEPGLTAAILPASRPDPNRAEVELTIAPDARVGLHTLGVITPLGVPKSQSFAVAADPEVSEREPNDRWEQLGGEPTRLPATLLGTIDRPGDVDLFRIRVQAGQRLVFQVVARSLGSKLLPALSLQGEELARVPAGADVDPVYTYTARVDGVITLQVADADYGGPRAPFFPIPAPDGPAR